MTRLRYARMDVRYLLFADIYLRLEEPKSKRKAFGLLEAAITCYAKKGFEAVTMEMIAREAGVTRTLLLHYFEDGSEIRELAIKYIRLMMQKIAIDFMESETTASGKLEKYVEACFFWSKNFRTHALVWLAFLHRCSGDKKLRELNTLASSVGADRIVSLIQLGQAQKVFPLREGGLEHAAKTIQALITGALIVSVSENLEDDKLAAEQTRQLCLQMARGG
jgi:AcrR family transcriptional regulator